VCYKVSHVVDGDDAPTIMCREYHNAQLNQAGLFAGALARKASLMTSVHVLSQLVTELKSEEDRQNTGFSLAAVSRILA
jgi:hypothetical protein